MLKNLQVLRAFAALCVVVHHYNFLNFHPGAFGVDIFFVISGFIIAFTTQKNNQNFFLKRLLRIVPMYYLATFLVIICWSIKPLLFNTTHVNLTDIIKTLLFIPYPNGPILGLGYTLNFEMFFYLVTYLFLRLIKKVKIALWCTSLFIILYYFTVTIVRPTNIIFQFYGSNILLEFVYGIILFFIYDKIKGKNFTKGFLNKCFIIALLSLLFLLYTGYPEIPLATRGFTFGIPAFIICGCAVFSNNYLKQDSLLYQFFLTLGNASYILYLIHPFVIFGILRVVHPLFNSQNIFVLIIQLLLSLSIVCYTSIIIHKKIEIPLQRFLKSKFLV